MCINRGIGKEVYMMRAEYLKLIENFARWMDYEGYNKKPDWDLNSVINPEMSLLEIVKRLAIKRCEITGIIDSSDRDKFKAWLKNILIGIDIKDLPDDEIGSILHLLVASESTSYFFENSRTGMIIEILLDMGADPNAKNVLGHTFVETAISCRNYDWYRMVDQYHIEWYRRYNSSLIKKAKEKGLDVNTKDNLGNSIAHTAISNPYYYQESIVDLMKDLGEDFDVNIKNNKGQDIIQYMEYFIHSDEGYIELGYTDPVIIRRHRYSLLQQSIEIKNYIYARRNFSKSGNELETFEELLREYGEIKTSNEGLAYILSEYEEDKFYEQTTNVMTLSSANSIYEQKISIKEL